jgi:acetyl-CoA C-acetyltransferase
LALRFLNWQTSFSIPSHPEWSTYLEQPETDPSHTLLNLLLNGETMSEAYIVAAARTAGGRRNGRLSGWHPADLAGQVLNALVDRAGADPAIVEDVILGCVGQVGEQSMNIARGAVLASKLPESVPATSIDRQCGSSQQALHFAAQAVMSGTMDVVIAAGVESMTRVPMGTPSTLPLKNGLGFYVSPQMQERYRGIEFSQFAGAEMMAKKYGFEKDALDAYALHSHRLAAAAVRAGRFEQEIVSLPARMNDGTEPGEMHTVDEGIRFDATLEGIAAVKLIAEGGRVTAATASQICDGASGILIVNERGLKTLGVQPLARIHHMSVIGHDPVIMLEAPLPATQRALNKAGLKIKDIDLYEVNEAFAPVPLAWLQALDADPARLNVNGGAIALGHPLGSSGTRLMTTLVHALGQRGERYGLQTMCEGGGMANVTIVERL